MCDYDKWDGAAGPACFTMGGTQSSVSLAEATGATTVSEPDYYTTLAITNERQDPMLQAETGKHMAMNDGGANRHAATLVFSDGGQSRHCEDTDRGQGKFSGHLIMV